MASSQNGFFLFVPHKAASVFVGDLFGHIAQGIGLIRHDLDLQCFKTGEDKAVLYRKMTPQINETSCYCGPMRGVQMALDSFDMAGKPSIIHLRDPRDCLVSFYFSQAYSHTLKADSSAQEKILSNREEALATSIDDYVLKKAEEGLYKDFLDGALALHQNPNAATCLSRYEEMIVAAPFWLIDLIAFLDIPVDTPAVAEALLNLDFSVKKENKNSHMRQVSSGDFRRKLKPETQKALTAHYAPYLEAFGYMEEQNFSRLWSPEPFLIIGNYFAKKAAEAARLDAASTA